jgi:hypothetical protein
MPTAPGTRGRPAAFRLARAIAALAYRLAERWRGYCTCRERELGRLRRLAREGELLRVELSHLEREIYEVRSLPIPRRQRELLESAIRTRYRRVDLEMLERENEVLASGHVIIPW